LPIVRLSERCASRVAHLDDDLMLLRLRLALHIPRFSPPATDEDVGSEAYRLLNAIREDQSDLD